MRVPVSWLRDYVAIDMPLEELATALSIATRRGRGHRPSRRRRRRRQPGPVLVGRVLEAEKHPNADRLQLCMVDVGEGDARSIVCGAWNFGAGATVAVALPGAVTAERPRARAAHGARRGVRRDDPRRGRAARSAPTHAGIIVLPESEPGTPLAEVLPLVEHILLVESTGNRPDLLAIYGIAREVAALYDLHSRRRPAGRRRSRATSRCSSRSPTTRAARATSGGCSRTSRSARRRVAARRLHAAGMRPISNVVDVTNYVMLALGNPLHAFDFTKLAGGRIVVRRADAGERLRTLDGVDRELVPDDLLIADAERGVALAGIMGGEETEIGDDTTTSCSRPRTSSRTASSARPSGCASAPRARTAGRRASTRTSPGRRPTSRRGCCSSSGARWTRASDVHADLPR
jgi:phenylalanyl-tRNA synthetase beta chain